MITNHCIDYLISSFSLLDGASAYDRAGVKAHKDYIEGMITENRLQRPEPVLITPLNCVLSTTATKIAPGYTLNYLCRAMLSLRPLQ